jgi:hypothetical protein
VDERRAGLHRFGGSDRRQLVVFDYRSNRSPPPPLERIGGDRHDSIAHEGTTSQQSTGMSRIIFPT